MKPERDKLYLISEASIFFDFLTERKTGRNRTIWMWVKSGKLKATRMGGFYYVKGSDIEEFLNNGNKST